MADLSPFVRINTALFAALFYFATLDMVVWLDLRGEFLWNIIMDCLSKMVAFTWVRSFKALVKAISTKLDDLTPSFSVEMVEIPLLLLIIKVIHDSYANHIIPLVIAAEKSLTQ
jgi:hypothetical protein